MREQIFPDSSLRVTERLNTDAKVSASYQPKSLIFYSSSSHMLALRSPMLCSMTHHCSSLSNNLQDILDGHQQSELHRKTPACHLSHPLTICLK